MIELSGLCKQFATSSGAVTALLNVDLQVESSERLGVFGPSGCGKTTLLRCLAGLDAPDSGTIKIGGKDVFNKATGIDVPPWDRPIGLVFQDYALWPHMHVMDNVLFPLVRGRRNALTRAECREIAREALHSVRLDDLIERYPYQLSGGQRQRVALARAIASRPALLLMDEPLSSLDPHLREHTRHELIAILEDTRITTIFVSHEHRDCLLMADSVGIMWNGRLVQRGSPSEIVANPLDAGVAETLACGALIQCRRSVHTEQGMVRYEITHSDQFVELRTSSAHSLPEEAVLLFPHNGFRLRSRTNTDASSMLLGKVVRVAYIFNLGWCILARIGSAHIEVWNSEHPAVQRDDTIELVFDMDRVRVLPKPSGHAGV